MTAERKTGISIGNFMQQSILTIIHVVFFGNIIIKTYAYYSDCLLTWVPTILILRFLTLFQLKT